MSLIAWYKLDGNANDSSGYENHGSTSGTVNWINGKINQAFSTDISTGQVVTPIIDNDLPEIFTISCWVKIKAWGLSQGIYGTRSSGGFMMYRNAGDSNGTLRYYHHYTNTSDVNTTSYRNIYGNPLNEWFHLTATRGLGFYDTYRNGELIYSDTISDFKKWLHNSVAFRIGAGGTGWTTSQMDIDDLRIYNYILSTKEIKELAKAKVLHYDFNIEKTNGEIIRDKSGYDNDAILDSNCPTWSSGSYINEGCYEFDGSKYIQNIDASNFCNEEGTISMWIKPYFDGASSYPNHIYFLHSPGTNKSFQLWNSNGFMYWLEGWTYDTRSRNWVANSWYHIVVSWKYPISDSTQTGVKLYLNGSSNETIQNTSEYSYGSTISIGTNFSGSISDVRVYNTELSNDDIQELYQTRAQFDNKGNIHVPELIETKHEPLTLDYTVWEDGQIGSVTGFSQNGSTSENNRLLSDDPWGKETVIWRTTPDSTSGADGGWNSSYHSIDRNYTYRWAVWVRRYTVGTGGTFYLGLNPSPIRNDNGSTQSNPYFTYTAISNLTYNQWYLIIGHCFYEGYSGGRHPDSGWYQNGIKIPDKSYGNVGTQDVRWAATTTTSMHRAYHYYTTNINSGIDFVYPRLDKCDGTEPSINELLSGHDSRNIDYVRSKGGTSNISLDIDKKGIIRTGILSEIGTFDGLIGYWPLNGDVEDYSIYKNNGTNNGATIVSGHDNNLAYNIDGTQSITNINTDLGGCYEATLTMWISSDWDHLTGNSTFQSLFVQQKDWDYLFGFHQETAGYLCISHRNNGTLDRNIINTNMTSYKNIWTHIVGTFNRGNYKIYINGIKVAEQTGSYTQISSELTGYDFNIGNNPYDSRYFCNSNISDVRVYNKELTAQEVKILYDLSGGSDITKIKQNSKYLYIKGNIKEN